MKRGTKTNNFNGPVAGMGIDIVDIPRFRKTLASRGKRFIDRIFLPGEKKYCRAKARPWIHYAGRFAAKEAVAKAFGTGIGGKISWRDIEIISADLKAPVVKLSLRAQKLARQRRIRRVFISISHTRAYTTAAALLA
jgi:holo-[acyl-carrier protein] synthase